VDSFKEISLQPILSKKWSSPDIWTDSSGMRGYMPDQSVKSNPDSRRMLLEEARRQSEALKSISKWRSTAFIIAAVGAALIYGGVMRESMRTPLIAVGAVITALGLAAAVLCDMGIRNGRKNVEKILDAAEKSTK
jgi:hypothetical protein